MKEKRQLEEFELFLFDLDGLLLDTEKVHFRAYQVLCEKFGYLLTIDFLRYCELAHHTEASSWKEFFYQEFPLMEEKFSSWDELKAEKKKIYLELASEREIFPMPGAKELLQRLQKGHKTTCVVTNSSRLEVDLLFKKAGILESIDHWIVREDYTNPKPAPDGYLRAIETFWKGGKIIGFEDSWKGICALEQTPALPILVCPLNHPQLQRFSSLKKTVYYESLQEIFSF